MGSARAEALMDPEDPTGRNDEALLPPLPDKESETWKAVRKWSCLSVVVLSLLLIVAGIICAGVIPSKSTAPVVTLAASATRTRYIAAEEISWSYTPGGKDLIYGDLEGTLVQHTTDPIFVHGTFIKGHFVEYTDATFTVQVNRSSDWEHLGLLGPIIHAEAGDTIEVWLQNRLLFPVNLEPLGNSWNIEGMLGPVGSGMTAMFRIRVPLEAGPPANSTENSLLYLYRSSINPTRHENSGLVGGMIITRKGDANPNGTPKGVDRELVTMLQIFNEIETEFIHINVVNITKFGWGTTYFAMNGYSWGTLPGLTMKTGERVRWYLAGLGTENGMHNFHWHGNVLESHGHHIDQVTSIPATTLAADMVPDNPGQWLYHCHVNSHLTSGMASTYRVEGPLPPPTTGGVERNYFIAADEVEWDYAPLGGTACTQDGSVEPFEEGSAADAVLGAPNGTRIGSKYMKAMFREYTDATFTTLKPRAAGDAYLGLLGPVLRAQVGDTFKIVFKNQLTDFPATMHPHGVLYNKSSEGAPYMDGTSGYDRSDDAVQPGSTHTYIWEVPDRAGPGPSDPSSLMWMYHSHADESKDTWAGLAGPIIITRRGEATQADGSPLDVDSEWVLFFAAMDESRSLYSNKNIEKYLGAEANATELHADDAFLSSSVHHAINGYMYCNMPRVQIKAGSRVRLHYMSLGDIQDMHTPGMGRGGGFLNLGQREDSIQMSAGGMHSVDVLLTAQGTWQLGCNVLSHEAGGLVAMYEVLAPDNAPPAATGVVRTFYVQAEPALWNYAPKGYVQCTQANYLIRSSRYLDRTTVAIGSGMFHKALYRQYSDASFSQLVPQADYMGLLGPLMVLETGDTLRVVLKNTLPFDVNLNPGGGLVATGDAQAGQAVKPNETFQYEWVVPEEAGPTAEGMSSVGYAYKSTVNHWTETVLGLEGILVVARKGELSASLLPRGVDYLVPLLWQVFDENLSPYLEDNMRAAGLDVDAIDKEDEAFVESNIKHTINGRMYCNLPPPNFHVGARVRWVFLSVGATEGLHSPVFTKFPLIDAKGPHESATLMPGYTSTMDMVADATGLYPMWCNVHDHVEAGMIGNFRVNP